MRPPISFWSSAILIATGWFFAVAPEGASAHPLSQGSLEVVIHRDSVFVRARITKEEVAVTNLATTPGAQPGPWASEGQSAYEQHSAYLAAHLQVIADGTPLAGGVSRVSVPEPAKPTQDPAAVYELIYPLPRAAMPSQIELRDDVLADGNFAPGMAWEATYVVKIRADGGAAAEGMLLTRARPIRFQCEPDASTTTDARSSVRRGGLFRDYFLHGVRHILTGYDHLLFVSALVLAATSLWDLVKVVSAFTLAHTITLTLAALNWVHLPERVVEPLIAASIVFVALQNVFWPRRARGWSRLAAAFFFGLFHGLGFAGGLLEAMQEMQGTTILLAIAAFSIGVEAGHQIVVLPLFTVLRVARQSRADPAARDRLSMAAQRVGSAAISIAGMFYLFLALKPGE